MVARLAYKSGFLLEGGYHAFWDSVAFQTEHQDFSESRSCRLFYRDNGKVSSTANRICSTVSRRNTDSSRVK